MRFSPKLTKGVPMKGKVLDYAIKAVAVLGLVLGWQQISPYISPYYPWNWRENPASNSNIKAAVDEVKEGLDKLSEKLEELKKGLPTTPAPAQKK
jgi:hypothetical protein